MAEDRFEAVLGALRTCVDRGLAEAMSSNRSKRNLASRTRRGELVWVDFEPSQRHRVAGSFADDDTLPELCAEIYRQRDADLAP